MKVNFTETRMETGEDNILPSAKAMYCYMLLIADNDQKVDKEKTAIAYALDISFDTYRRSCSQLKQLGLLEDAGKSYRIVGDC